MYIQTQQSTESQLSQIYAGMEVFDANTELVGTVSLIRFGENHHEPADLATITTAIDASFDHQHHLPKPLYTRLYKEGFILVNRGFLENDVILVPNQIDQILADAIFLNVEQAALQTV